MIKRIRRWWRRQAPGYTINVTGTVFGEQDLAEEIRKALQTVRERAAGGRGD